MVSVVFEGVWCVVESPYSQTRRTWKTSEFRWIAENCYTLEYKLHEVIVKNKVSSSIESEISRIKPFFCLIFRWRSFLNLWNVYSACKEKYFHNVSIIKTYSYFNELTFFKCNVVKYLEFQKFVNDDWRLFSQVKNTIFLLFESTMKLDLMWGRLLNRESINTDFFQHKFKCWNCKDASMYANHCQRISAIRNIWQRCTGKKMSLF